MQCAADSGETEGRALMGRAPLQAVTGGKEPRDMRGEISADNGASGYLGTSVTFAVPWVVPRR